MEVFRFLSGEVYKTPDLGFHLDQTVLKNHVVLVSVRRVLCPVHARGLKEAVPLHQGGDLRRIGARAALPTKLMSWPRHTWL